MNTDSVFQESASHTCSENIKCGIGVFECNICFDLAQDPVVTLCGHLFCWPCLYKWLQFHSYSHECPICKALVDEDSLVPIYGRGTTSSDIRAGPLSGDEVPSRPASRRPQTARARDLTYFRQDGSGATWGSGFMPMATSRLGGLARTALVGAISSVSGLQGRDYLFSTYAHGGYYGHGFHQYPIHVQGTKLVLFMMCFLFLSLFAVLMVISSLFSF